MWPPEVRAQRHVRRPNLFAGGGSTGMGESRGLFRSCIGCHLLPPEMQRALGDRLPTMFVRCWRSRIRK